MSCNFCSGVGVQKFVKQNSKPLSDILKEENERIIVFLLLVILIFKLKKFFFLLLKKVYFLLLKKGCNFCSIRDCILGIQKIVKITEKQLSDILKEESDKKQKIGNKLMKQNDKQLCKTFNLDKESKKQKFNNLALDKIRTDKDNAEDLGKLSSIYSMKST